MNQLADGVVYYSAVLRPHRSLGQRTTTRAVLVVAGAWFLIGMAFIAIGAWPVLPFMGLEVLLLLLFFRLNERAGNVSEAINLTPSALTVRRTDAWGQHSLVSFPPRWLQVNLEPAAGSDNRLELRSHGRSLTIASFLPPQEREAVAVALRRALARQHAATPRPLPMGTA
ncbi:MAG: DUF2244 domain-containing protein [Rhodospirillales bacterium]